MNETGTTSAPSHGLWEHLAEAAAIQLRPSIPQNYINSKTKDGSTKHLSSNAIPEVEARLQILSPDQTPGTCTHMSDGAAE